MTNLLQGKKVIVTGASRGIGRAIALCAAQNGAVVGINYLNSRNEAEKLAAEIDSAGLPKAILMRFDATKSEEIETALKGFIAGYKTVDGWVNNAAINIPGLLPALTEDEIRRQIESALTGPVISCRVVIPYMMENRCGSIVNIGSVVTEKVFRGQSVYAAAKGGIKAFTRALACEYGRKGIRVNCVQPGPVETGMFAMTKDLAGEEIKKRIPAGKFSDAQDVASTVVFLLSDLSRGITGECINVDGGYAIA